MKPQPAEKVHVEAAVLRVLLAAGRAVLRGEEQWAKYGAVTEEETRHVQALLGACMMAEKALEAQS